jgi:hypothetical protein
MESQTTLSFRRNDKLRVTANNFGPNANTNELIASGASGAGHLLGKTSFAFQYFVQFQDAIMR